MLNNKTIGSILNEKIILAVIWIAGMLSSLNGDTYRLHDPDKLKSSLENTAAIKVTPELLLIMSIIFVVPILMSVLTLTFKDSVSRCANRIIGIFYAIIILAFWVLGVVMKSDGYEIVWSTAQLVFAILAVWYAWKWPKQEA